MKKIVWNIKIYDIRKMWWAKIYTEQNEVERINFHFEKDKRS